MWCMTILSFLMLSSCSSVTVHIVPKEEVQIYTDEDFKDVTARS
jgi:uncharacterized protein YceK